MADRRGGERVELLEDGAVAIERSRRGEAGQVERERALAAPREAVEHEPPRVRRVREAVQQHQRRAVPLELVVEAHRMSLEVGKHRKGPVRGPSRSRPVSRILSCAVICLSGA